MEEYFFFPSDATALSRSGPLLSRGF